MATLTYTPLEGTEISQVTRYRAFQFSGFQQRQSETINPLNYSVNVKFQFSRAGRITGLPTLAEFQTFYNQHGNHTPFEFDCPSLGVLNWVINSVRRNHISGDLWEIGLSIESWNSAKVVTSGLVNPIDPVTMVAVEQSSEFTIPYKIDGTLPTVNISFSPTSVPQPIILQTQDGVGTWFSVVSTTTSATVVTIWNLPANFVPFVVGKPARFNFGPAILDTTTITFFLT